MTKKTDINFLQLYNTVNGQQLQTNVQRSSSGFVSGGSSPLVFIPKSNVTPTTTTEGRRMSGPIPNT